MPVAFQFLLLALVLAWTRAQAESSSGLTSILRVIAPNGAESLAAATDVPTGSSKELPIAFQAVVLREWPAGLVPLFPVEKSGGFELRRLPPKGRENFTDPLCFSLPRTDETNAVQIAGRWTVQSTNSSLHRHSLIMELAAEGGQVAGRLDQDTDYRFAHVTGGTWRTNHLKLVVEYINDRYELAADLHEAQLLGTWRKTDDTEHGTWSARRPSPPLIPSDATAVTLHEWRGPEGRKLYLTGDGPGPVGWKRVDPAIGRVWSDPSSMKAPR